MIEWGHNAGAGKPGSGGIDHFAGVGGPFGHRVGSAVHALQQRIGHGDAGHLGVQKLGVPGCAQGQDAHDHGDADLPGGASGKSASTAGAAGDAACFGAAGVEDGGGVTTCSTCGGASTGMIICSR